MASKKNKNLALTNYVSKVATSISNAESSFPIDANALTAQDKKHSVKVRKGADTIVRQIAELVKAHGLDSTALHSDDMLDQLDTSNALVPLISSIEKISKRASDAQYSASTDSWDKALQFYALLQRRAQTDGQLAEALAPITSFFSYRHQSVLESKPTKLQTRMNAKLKSAERLVARSKPRASVLEQENMTPAPAPQPAKPSVIQPAPTPPSVAVVTQQPAPAAAPLPAPTVTIAAPVANGVTNGASNGYVNGASNGALTSQ